MKNLVEIAQTRDDMATVVSLTSAFEGIASMRIAQIKDQALQSQQFFAQLWQIYNQIRVDELFHFGRRLNSENIINKDLLILITGEGGFSGDIDERLVSRALEAHEGSNNDIIVIGGHGLTLLRQRGVVPTRSFQLPKKDQNISASSLISEVQKYQSTTVYYQVYRSLMKQDIQTIKLATAVTERGLNIEPGKNTISESNYLFEPSTFAVVDHLERSMMQITLSDVILESKLAQYASRFRAMSLAEDKAKDSLRELTRNFNRARLHIKDERLKEILNGLRSAQI